MSTKLYNGLKLYLETDSMLKLQEVLLSVQQAVRGLANKEIQRAADKVQLKEGKDSATYIDAIISHSRLWRSSIGVWGIGDGKYLCCVFADFGPAKQIIDLLVSKFGFSNYAYWDNADPPEGVEEDEWNQRAKEWDKVVSYSRTMGESMLVLDLIGPYWTPKLESDKT